MPAKKILYAEDEFTNRKIMEIQCQKAGVDCILVEDGRMALKRIQEEEFSVIILDQYMPGLNGDAVARSIRETNKDIPLIAITSDDSKAALLLDCGFNKVYIKPLRIPDYQEIISDFI